MKVLLIRSQNGENINTRLPESLNKRQGVLPPLGISYIASTLEKSGYIVRILDVVALNLIADEVRQYINEFKPEITGVTTMTPALPGALEMARIAKESGSTTVLGGPHMTIYPKETLSYSYVDYGINGEGESVMLNLIKSLEGKNRMNSIQGLIYKHDGNVYINDPAIEEDLDSLSFPAYHLLPMERYNSIIGLYPVSTMISSRGCPYKCNFCFKQPSDKKIRFRSAKNIVDEMELLVDRYKVKEIMFYDDIMTINRSRMVDICEEILIRNLKVKWETPSRVEHVDKELLMLMHKAGCIRLRYGVESGDEKILKLMNKRINLDLVTKTFKSTKDVGIETFAYFMIGYFYETKKTIQKTINFAKKIDADLVMFTVATPLPQTPLYDLAKNEGFIIGDYWREFTLGKNTHTRIPYFLPDAEKWIKLAYRRFYLRPNYILKQLKKIHSWDTIKKYIYAFLGISLFRMKNNRRSAPRHSWRDRFTNRIP